MIALQQDVSLAELTTIGLGGKAKYFVCCETRDELVAGIRVADEYGMPMQVLGGGSNTIFRDEGFEGLVMKVGLRGIRYVQNGADVTLSVAAGEDWDAFVRFCVAHGFGGVECLSGIPGLVGAVPMQNVGAYGQEAAETIVEVCAINRRTLEDVRFSNAECRFGYRRSRFNAEDVNAFVITEVTFRLRADAEARLAYPELRAYAESHLQLSQLKPGLEQLAAVREAVLALRRRKSMVIDPNDPNARSVGSFFKNPILTPEAFDELKARCRQLGIANQPPTFPHDGHVKVPAAWLVENAGYSKGFRKGGVGISANHALALVNFGGTTRELLSLAAEIQTTVAARFGIRLEREPVVVS